MPDHRKNDEGSNRKQGQDVGHEHRRLWYIRLQVREWSGRLWPLVGFSPRKQNMTLYIMPGFSKFDELMSRLGKYKTGKSCLYIKTLDDVDQKKLKALIDGSVKYMKRKYSVK